MLVNNIPINIYLKPYLFSFNLNRVGQMIDFPHSRTNYSSRTNDREDK